MGMPYSYGQLEEHIIDADAPILKEFTCEVTLTDVQLSFETDLLRSASELSGDGVKNISLTFKDLSRLPHTLACAALGLSNTDEPLSKIQKLNDTTDRLTPDFIGEKDGEWVVLEVKTHRSNRRTKEVAENATQKYQGGLRMRSLDRDIRYEVLVVTPMSVVTNRHMNRLEMYSVIQHYLMGLTIQDRAREKGWIPDQDEERQEVDKVLMAVLESIELPKDQIDPRGDHQPLYIDEEMVRKWDNMETPTLHSIFTENIPEAVKLYDVKSKKNPALTEAKFSSYFASVSKMGGKNSPDTIIHLPIADIKRSYYDPAWTKITAELADTLTAPEAYSGIWRKALLAVEEGSEKYREVSPEDMKKLALKEEGWEKVKEGMAEKSTHFCVRIKPTKGEREEMATRGVQAKGIKHSVRVDEHYKDSKKGYTTTTYTGDVSDSIESGFRIFQTKKRQLIHTEDLVRDLIDKAYQVSGTEQGIAETSMRRVLRSQLFSMLSFLDEVVAEVNISRMKNLKKDNFMLKKMPHYDAYLLIKTTSTDKHIFFSVLVPKDSFIRKMPLSEDWVDLGGCFCTKFVSLDRHRITHLLYSTYKAACLWFFWCHQFNFIDTGDKTSAENPDRKNAFDHFWIALLIYLEDKEQTSTNLQLVRYAYMEVIKGGALRPEPEKITNKLAKIIRSRLLLWCLDQIATAFIRMARHPPKIGRAMKYDMEEESQDTAEGLLSWITHKPLPKFEVALNLSYMGVLHNKDEGNLVHGYLKIFDKLLTQELKVKDASIEDMTVGKKLVASELKDHEFSAAAVKAFATHTRDRLQSKFGDYDAWAKSLFTEVLSDKTVLELATTKSSTMPDLEDHEGLDDEDPGVKEKTKTKCMENMLKVIKDLDIQDNKIFCHLDKSIREVEKTGMKVSLFKKLQIGGTREIFIMELMSRINVAYIEAISRALCSHLTCEMLTKGDQKLGRSDDHFLKRRQLMRNRKSVTLISSDDAATWAQRFMMPVFGVMFRILVPAPFFAALIRILNLVTSKSLILPKELLDLFKMHMDVMSTLECMNILKAEYLQNPEERWLLAFCGSRFLRNLSNMMQGVLHFTSSLLHAILILALAHWARQLIRREVIIAIILIIITLKNSSDDSSASVTMAANPDHEVPLENIVKFGTILLLLKGVIYPLICAKQSEEKSTVANAKMVEEFNSLWYYRNTLMVPSIKFVAQACRTHVSDRFETRLNVMSTLRGQVFEASGSSLMAAYCQSAQARCHYITMGLGSHKLFKSCEELLLSRPHPTLGFFLVEPELMCGMFGQNFSLYLACRRSPIVRALTKKFSVSSSLSMMEIDASICKLSITQGSTTRYRQMLDRMGVDLNAEMEFFDNNPEVLCRNPQSQEELIHRLRVKAATPSVADSFEFLTDSKLHAASSYVLHTDCVSKMTRVVTGRNEEGKLVSEVTMEKLSLFKILHDESEVDVENLPIDMSELTWLFPNRSIYETSYTQILPSYESRVPTKKVHQRSCYFLHPFVKFDIRYHASPVNVCANKWFGHHCKSSKFEIDQTWGTIKSLFSWITDEYSTTLKNCPHGSAIGLFSFLRQLNIRHTTVRCICPLRRTATEIDAVTLLISRAFWPMHFLEKDVMRSIDEGGEEYIRPMEAGAKTASKIMTALWLYHESWMGPLTHEIATQILGEADDVVLASECERTSPWLSLKSNEAKIAIFQLVSKHQKTRVGTLLANAKKGLRGSFTQAAKYSEVLGKYVGQAIYQGYFNGIPFQASMIDETLLFIVLKSRDQVRVFSQGLGELIRELRCSSMPIIKPEGVSGYLEIGSHILSTTPGVDRVPIKFNEGLEVSRLYHTVKFSVDDSGIMRLRMQPGPGRASTVLSMRPFVPPSLDIGDFLQDLDESDPLRRWMDNESLTFTVAKTMISKAAEVVDTTYQPGSEDWKASHPIETWIRKTLKDRAAFQKIIHSSIAEMASMAKKSDSDICIHLDQTAVADEEMVGPQDLIFNLDHDFLDEMMDFELFDDFDAPDERSQEELIMDWATEVDQVATDPDLAMFRYLRPPLSGSDSMPHFLKTAEHAFWTQFLDRYRAAAGMETRMKAFSGVDDEEHTPTGVIIRKLYGGEIVQTYSGSCSLHRHEQIETEPGFVALNADEQ
nr:MAG: RNA-dependent RNA polymerase [Spider peribunya-like virus 2]